MSCNIGMTFSQTYLNFDYFVKYLEELNVYSLCKKTNNRCSNSSTFVRVLLKYAKPNKGNQFWYMLTIFSSWKEFSQTLYKRYF
jgi:hypothetical protein